MSEGLGPREPATDRPDCPDCAAARQDPNRGLFGMHCLGCVARHLADSPAAWRAVRTGDAAELVASIRTAWGDRYAEGRRAVWDWIRRLKDARAPT